jgi:valyl-tRNA synthetase
MKLTKLQSIQRLEKLSPKRPRKKSLTFLNEIEVISYATSICLQLSRVLNNEIQVKDRNKTLKLLQDEVDNIYKLISKKDFLIHSNYTKQNTKQFFKDVGIKN